jgi:simple sugar transport system substrate-binding protein
MFKRALLAGAFVCAVAAGAPSFAADTEMYKCDKHFIFFPGGSEGDPFATVVYNGAVAAAQHTGCKVDYYWSAWNPETMIKQFKEAVALKPDGIAIYGFPGDEAMRPIVLDALKNGIAITTMNTPLPKLEQEHKSEGFGYAGAVLYDAGYNLAAKAIEVCGLKSGDKAFLWGLLSMPNRGDRTKGAKDALEKAGISVVYQEISDAVNSDASQGTPVYVATYSANPDMKLVITDHGGLTASLPTYMKAAGHGNDAVCGAGFDLSPAIAAGIKDGSIDVVIDQQPFIEGYIPIIQLFLTTKFGFAGLNMDTGAAFVTKDNIGIVEPLANAQIR